MSNARTEMIQALVERRAAVSELHALQRKQKSQVDELAALKAKHEAADAGVRKVIRQSALEEMPDYEKALAAAQKAKDSLPGTDRLEYQIVVLRDALDQAKTRLKDAEGMLSALHGSYWDDVASQLRTELRKHQELACLYLLALHKTNKGHGDWVGVVGGAFLERDDEWRSVEKEAVEQARPVLEGRYGFETLLAEHDRKEVAA